MADWPYSTQRWQRLRRLKLGTDPLCQYCPQGTLTPASEVDQRQPINSGGDPWLWENLASTCTPCHSRKSRAEQQGKPQPAATVKGVDPQTGIPHSGWWTEKKISGS
jgi:5-methylcytosine-specific restriction endonuclease McrA